MPDSRSIHSIIRKNTLPSLKIFTSYFFSFSQHCRQDAQAIVDNLTMALFFHTFTRAPCDNFSYSWYTENCTHQILNVVIHVVYLITTQLSKYPFDLYMYFLSITQ